MFIVLYYFYYLLSSVFLRVEVLEALFGLEQGWEINRRINYQLINSRGVTIYIVTLDIIIICIYIIN
jgi:hypothetical protein